MTLLKRIGPLVAAACLVLGHPIHAAAPAARPPGTPVVLAAQPRTPLGALARQLAADDLREAGRNGDEPLLLVGSARLGGAADHPALFVQLQSPRECGSAGCSTQVYAWVNGGYARVLDGVGGPITVSPTRHKGMADLLTNTERYVWDGRAYRDSQPAPDVNVRPRAPHKRAPAG